MPHFAIEPHERQRKNQSSGTFDRAALCGNGDAHAELTRTADHVDCDACQAELAAKPDYLDAFAVRSSAEVTDWELFGTILYDQGNLRYAVWHDDNDDKWQATAGAAPSNSAGYGNLEALLALKGLEMKNLETVPPSEREDLRKLLVTVLEESASHLAYIFGQQMLDIEDGGFASIYNSHVAEPYEGLFGNAVGGAMLRTIYHSVGHETFIERHPLIFSNDLPLPAVDRVEQTDYDSIGRTTSQKMIEHLHAVFPTLAEDALERFRPALAEFARGFARAQHQFEMADAPKP